MRIIKTSKYKKLAEIDKEPVTPEFIGVIAVDIAMAAKNDFGKTFLALKNMGLALNSGRRIESRDVPKAINDVILIAHLSKSYPSKTNYNYAEGIQTLMNELGKISIQNELEDDFNNPPYEGGKDRDNNV